MRKIVYQRADGGTSIVTPIINTRGIVEGDLTDEPEMMTEAEAEQRAWAKLPADAIAPRYAEESEIPTDRTFRNAWKPDLSVDMEKAREIHKDTLRQARAPLLAALDIDYQRADEANDAAAKKSIAAEKQRLRDVTDDPAIAAAETPDELKAVMPDALK